MDSSLLAERLERVREGLSVSGRMEVSQLRGIFEPCAEDGITLEELEASRHLHKHREASAHLDNTLTRDSLSDEEGRKKSTKAHNRVRSDSTRRATRQSVRQPRKRPI